MKKTYLLTTLAIVCLGLFKAHAQLNKVALISVYGNRNLSDNPLEKAMNEQLLNDSSFNLMPFVEKFCTIINDDLLKEFPFPFVPKEEVINAPGYKELEKYTREGTKGSTYDIAEGKVPIYNVAKGYIPIASFGIVDDVAAIKKAFEVLPADVDGVMIAFLSFDLVDQAGAMGITVKKVRAYVNIKIFNREGKRIFKLKEYETSDKGMVAVAGFVAETKKIMPHIKDASEQLYEAMKKKLPKSLAKLAKKIAKDKED
jgi:hypothetical protein